MIAVTLLLAATLGSGPTPPVHFDTEILPILTKAGCNAGACHGAAAGRGGFRLSLLGGDPNFDYESIVQEWEGRRINLARPDASLILAKPTGMLDHGGGVPLDDGSPDAVRIASWIAAGAPRGAPRRLTRFVVHPARAVVSEPGTRVTLRAEASFDGGPPVDVTAWTVFTSADPAAVSVEPLAVSDSTASPVQATVHRPGQHVVVARYLDRVVPLQWTLPLAAKTVDLTGERRANFVDERVLETLGVLGLPVSPPAEDATWLRRLSLDLTGTLPTPEEIAEFVADPSPDKRARCIEQRLASDTFADYWALRFARLFRLHSLPNDREGAEAYYQWLRRQLQEGTPWNEVARELLTATGDSHVVGPANFARMAGDARAHAELVSQSLLGVRLQCANCHNHPLDRWTQDDYHGLAAIFARVERGREVRLAARGAVTNLRTGEPAIRRIPGDRYLPDSSDGREELAAWLTDAENPYFARATVNRLWQAMLGRGLVEPADDLRDTNPATHPELLDALAADFIQHGFDLRHTLRTIASSETYRRSSTPVAGNAADDRFYSHAIRKPLEPEVLADAVANVTGVADRYADRPAGTRAIAVYDPLTPAPSLDVLGRCTVGEACNEQAAGGGLPGKLHLLNGTLINQKITDPAGRLQQRIAAEVAAEEIVQEFYLRALGRRPSQDEQQYWLEQFHSVEPAARARMLEDFVWSLLNCSEFRLTW